MGEEEDLFYRTDLNRHQLWTTCHDTPYPMMRLQSQGQAVAMEYRGISVFIGKASDRYPLTPTQNIEVILTKTLVKPKIKVITASFIAG
jgi:hypothetical protein